MSAAPVPPAPEARRSRLPAFISELWQDPAAFRGLLAACVAIAAVGLDPHIGDPGMPSVRSAIKEDEGLRSLLMVGAVIQAGLLLVGGLVADRFRSERLMRGALGMLVVASILAIIVPDGLPLVAVRFVAWVSTGLTLPFVVGAVAILYRGPARATALGLVFAVYGASTATAPALALINGPLGSPWPAFALCAVVAFIAMLVNRAMPDLPGADPRHRPTMIAVTLFSFGVVALVAATVQVGGGFDPLRISVVVIGLLCIGLSFVPRGRSADGLRTMGVDLRPVAVALGVGVVIGFAQAAPMLQLPAFFTAVQGAEPLVATVAIAPFVVALLIAGPVSGYLLARIGPRTLIAGGAIAVGTANLVIAAVLDPSTGYPFFVVPFLLIGAGFVVATTVRTAIIFASVPRDMPASAAALNEASIGMGARVGVVVAVVITTQTALETYAASLRDLPAAEAAQMVDRLRQLLVEFGLRSTAELTGSIDPSTFSRYADAVVAGMRAATIVPGIAAIITGIVAFFLMGPRDPVRSVWELADERVVPTADAVSRPVPGPAAVAQGDRPD